MIVLGTGLTVSAGRRRRPEDGEGVQARRGGRQLGAGPHAPSSGPRESRPAPQGFLVDPLVVFPRLIAEGSRERALGWVRGARSAACGVEWKMQNSLKFVI